MSHPCPNWQSPIPCERKENGILTPVEEKLLELIHQLTENQRELIILLKSSQPYPIYTPPSNPHQLDHWATAYLGPPKGWELFCNHANEVPNVCPCSADCGCRYYHCKGR